LQWTNIHLAEWECDPSSRTTWPLFSPPLTWCRTVKGGQGDIFECYLQEVLCDLGLKGNNVGILYILLYFTPSPCVTDVPCASTSEYLDHGVHFLRPIAHKTSVPSTVVLLLSYYLFYGGPNMFIRLRHSDGARTEARLPLHPPSFSELRYLINVESPFYHIL